MTFCMNYERYLFSSATGSSLSNFHLCSQKLRIWNLAFDSSEQAYQYFKALFHSRLDLTERILNEKSSIGCYRLGKRIQTSKLWQREKSHVMFHILKHKVYQCSEFRAELLANQSKVFCENTLNHFWGLGRNGRGLNTLGVLLHMLVGFWEADHLC